ncbi:MAG: DUF192 domain-containing protein [bacterium]
MRSFILLEQPQDTRKNRLIIGGFIVFVSIISYVTYYGALYGMSKLNLGDNNIAYVDDSVFFKTVKVKCGKSQFTTYITHSDSDREKGLSVFSKIKDEEAMIFTFDTPKKYSFWMKGMKFPIDIIWLDENGKIVDIAKSVQVNSYPNMITPSEDSLYVLEINAGLADKSKINIGDVCTFDSARLK